MTTFVTLERSSSKTSYFWLCWASNLVVLTRLSRVARYWRWCWVPKWRATLASLFQRNFYLSTSPFKKCISKFLHIRSDILRISQICSERHFLSIPPVRLFNTAITVLPSETIPQHFALSNSCYLTNSVSSADCCHVWVELRWFCRSRCLFWNLIILEISLDSLSYCVSMPCRLKVTCGQM